MSKKLCLFLLMITVLLSLGGVARAAVDIGQPVPSLRGPQLDGQVFDLAAQHGKITIVHFWATWCAPCKEEMPVLDAYTRAHPAIVVIAISADKARRKDDVMEAMKEFSFRGAMLGDLSENGFGNPSSLPITYVIDSKGILRAELTPDGGVLTAAALDNAVKPLGLH